MAGQYRFKDSNGNIVAQISASVGGAIAFSGSVVDFSQANNVILGNVQLAGTASNALLLDGFDSQAFAFTSSIHPFTASIAGTNTFTSSATARLNSIETISASNISRINSLETTSASVDTLNTTQNSRLDSLEAKTGSLASTGSNTFIGTQTITGSLYISSDLIVQGSSSLQNITASAVSIGTNIINLNTANPAIRYAGLSIGDSGSIGSSGSFLYDSVQDEMIFIHRGANSTVTSSVVLMGPQTYDTIGSESYLTNNRLVKGTGNEHIVDSNISDTGTLVTINSATSSFSGIVGIGITTPMNTLHLTGASSTPSLRLGSISLGFHWDIGRENQTTGDFIFNNANGGATSEKLRITHADGNLLVSSGATIYNSSGALYMRAGTSGDLILGAGGTNGYMRISSTGNVGIGTASVATRLTTYVGSGFITGTNDAIRLQVAGYYNTARNTIVWHQDGGDTILARFGLEWNVGTSQMNFIWRDMYNSTTGTTELMRLTGGGNLLVGDTSNASGTPTFYVKNKAGAVANIAGWNFGGTTTSENGNNCLLSVGAYYNGSSLIATNTTAANYQQYNGLHVWYTNSGLTAGSSFSNTERMRINSGGGVRIGNPTAFNDDIKLNVYGTGVWDGANIGLQNGGTGGKDWIIFSTNNAFGQGGGNLLFYNNSGPTSNALVIYANGNYDFGGSDVSDIRLKQDIENINFGLTEIMQLSPKSYHLKSKNNLNGENELSLRKRYGFIAQEVQPILPDTITGGATEDEYLGLDYNGVLAVAVKAIQELKIENNALKERIEVLENK